jgi:hypothetical protein
MVLLSIDYWLFYVLFPRVYNDSVLILTSSPNNSPRAFRVSVSHGITR